MMKLTEKDISILNNISLAAGIFTLIVAITMILSLVQLKIIKPLDSPALQSVKEQYDRNPADKQKAEEVRAMDLMARRAYFSSRWQVETGSYLLLAGAVIFILSKRIIAGSEKPAPKFPDAKPDIALQKKMSRKYLLIAAGVITAVAVISSFLLRSQLPAPGTLQAGESGAVSNNNEKVLLAGPGNINYPFFRGEGSRGIAGGEGYPVEWNGSDGKNIKWKIPVPRPGKSSPVIWGNKLFITGAEGNKCEVYCIDKNTGEIIWTASASDFPGASAEVPESDAEAGMAVSTAALTADVVCVIFGNGNMACFDHDGKQKWARNTGLPASIYGFSASLVIYEKILLVQYDSDDKVSLMGFDISTGKQRWETMRTGRPSWSSPVISVFDGVPQVIINGNPEVSAYDPVTGAELWKMPGLSGDVAPSIAVNSKTVFAVTDYAKIIAMRPGKPGAVIWEDNTYTPDVSSPVADDNYLFLSTGNGDAACYNAEKGDTLWGRYLGNPFYASPIISDGKVWFLDRTGMMHIVEAAGKFKLVASSPLGEEADCTPAFSEGKIYLRGRENLYCIAVN
jgi:outer membrane protein assembly factor BamB